MLIVNKLEVPIELSYNNSMLDIKDMKKELVIELNMFSEWFSRGERGIDEWEFEVNVDKIRKVWDDRDEDGEVDDEKLNEIESSIVWGDGGFMDNGVEQCMSRVDSLLEGKSIHCEGEEAVWTIGSKSKEATEIDFCKNKLELLKSGFPF